eukprot:gene4870-34633_t
MLSQAPQNALFDFGGRVLRGPASGKPLVVVGAHGLVLRDGTFLMDGRFCMVFKDCEGVSLQALTLCGSSSSSETGTKGPASATSGSGVHSGGLGSGLGRGPGGRYAGLALACDSAELKVDRSSVQALFVFGRGSRLRAHSSLVGCYLCQWYGVQVRDRGSAEIHNCEVRSRLHSVFAVDPGSAFLASGCRLRSEECATLHVGMGVDAQLQHCKLCSGNPCSLLVECEGSATVVQDGQCSASSQQQSERLAGMVSLMWQDSLLAL